MNKTEKTNVMRLLDASRISYNVKAYEYDENDLSGISAAKKINSDPDSVFKTLVARGDKTGFCVFCIPVSYELDLKKAAAVSGNKNVEMVHLTEILPLTGYLRGGCSPIGMKRKYPSYIDETALLSDELAVSAGQRGFQIVISPEDLISYADLKVSDLI